MTPLTRWREWWPLAGAAVLLIATFSLLLVH